MKKYNSIPVLCLSAICILLASCSSIKQSTAFSARKYYNFKHHDPLITLNKPSDKSQKLLSVPSSPPKAPIVSANKPLEFHNLAAKPIISSNGLKNSLKKAAQSKPTPLFPALSNVITSSSAPYNETISLYMPRVTEEMAPSATTGGNSSLDPAVLIVLAIFLSPLAVYLYDNAASTRFWIDLILWLLGVGLFAFVIFIGLLWLVAVIYAILIVVGKV